MASHDRGPAVCPNGHAMDDGLFNCPACGAFRPSVNDPRALIENGRVVGVKPPKPGTPAWRRAYGLEPRRGRDV